MFKLKFTLAFILVCLPAFSADEAIINYADCPFSAEVIESNIDRTVIQYSVNRYVTDKVNINGKEYLAFQKLHKESIIDEKGFPCLPRINRSIIIPDDGIMGYKVLSSEFMEIEDVDVSPSKGYIIRSVDPSDVPYTFGEIYNEDRFYPEESVTLGKPYILRDLRGMVVELNAFQYNPVQRTLRIYTNITIEVSRQSPGGINTFDRTSILTKIDPQFANIYSNHFINFDNLDYPTLFEPGSMLVICYDDFMDEMTPFIEWKIQKGVPTEIVPVSEVGNDWRMIKEYIQDHYQSSDLSYVLLVGDAAQLTTVPEDSGSDPVYTLLEGDDSYPEIFIGRFSAENVDQLNTQVQRTIEYEKYPHPGADWYHLAAGAASDQGAGAGHHGEADNEHMTLIAYKLLDYKYTQVDSAYAPWGEGEMISHFINEGISFFNYCGHGGQTGWGPPAYNYEYVDELLNSNMLPCIINVACSTGEFVEWTCFGETWLRATHELTGEPTGAIGAYMSRTAMGWTPGMDMQDEAVDLMVSDSMYTFGGLCFNGSMLMMDINTGWGGAWEFKNLTIFGDPSLIIRNDTPLNPDVTHDSELLTGESTFSVVVTNDGAPLKAAMICGMNDEIYASAVTDASGQATLTFDPEPELAGEFTLTVTGCNTLPYITEVDIIDPEGPFVVFDEFELQDDITGNDNGQLDYTETTELGITVSNEGAAAANDVIGILHSDELSVSILQNTVDFGTIQPGSSITVDRAFKFAISSDVNDGDPLTFLLITTDGVNSWESNFSIIAHAPDIVFESLFVDDDASGNGNSSLDPGETAELLVSVVNNGSSDAGVVDGVLSCSDPHISINSGSASFGALPAGESGIAIFELTVSSVCPFVYSVEFSLEMQDILGYNNSENFTAIVSDLPFSPSGPDDYGYLAYDRFDVPFMPEYEWVELHPDSGGSGSYLPFVQLDQVIHERLPFQFQFYGDSYDSLTISNKGYICMGITNEVYFQHFAIPDTNGSGAMIAGYWYDLVPMWDGSGEVWQWYDSVNHRYIVEYNHVPRYWQPDSFETFEIILLDPAHYPTLTGDGQIIVQYKDMSGSSLESGTIGIENREENDGIQYRYNAVYDINAHPVENGTALLFTTPCTAPNISLTMTPRNTPIIIPAHGGDFDYVVELENISTNWEMFDFWIEVVRPDSIIYGPLILEEEFTLNGGETFERNMTQSVPGGAPPGDYTYRANAGVYPMAATISDEFGFTKEGVDTDGYNNGWLLTGWEKENLAEVSDLPDRYALNQNYPNPFNSETVFNFALPEPGYVSLTVYNIRGQAVKNLVDEFLNAGNYNRKFKAVDLSSGIYFTRFSAGGYNQTMKILYIK